MRTSIPHGLDEIYTTFGDPFARGFEQANIVMFDLPYPLLYAGRMVMRSRAHRLAVENFIFAFERIRAAGLESEVQNYSGIYAPRPIRGRTNHPSTHSWGIAVDIEAEKYPLGSNSRPHEGVLKAFKQAGFFWGGDFKSRKDPMHFQLCTGY